MKQDNLGKPKEDEVEKEKDLVSNMLQENDKPVAAVDITPEQWLTMFNNLNSTLTSLVSAHIQCYLIHLVKLHFTEKDRCRCVLFGDHFKTHVVFTE